MAYKQQQAPGNLDTDGLRKFTQEQLLQIQRATQAMDDETNDNYTALNGRITTLETRPFREVLSAGRTYYVRTDGNNANNGLSNSAGGAFKTIQRAVDAVCSIDAGIYQVLVQVVTGTYNESISFGRYVGKLIPILTGDTTTFSNVTVNATGNDCFICDGAGTWWIQGFKLQTTGGGSGLDALNGGNILFGYIDFGTISVGYAHIRAYKNSAITCMAPYTISGSAQFHLLGAVGGVVQVTSMTITVTGTPTFASAFAYAIQLGNIYTSGTTWTGAAIGPRYFSGFNSTIYTGGAGATHFPGSVAGTTDATGAYG